VAPKILVTGINGQVGFELQRSLTPLGQVIALDRSRCDLANPESMRSAIREVRPDIIVNPAAYTAVDKAESDEVTAQAVNGEAPGIIGEEAAKLGALVIHYSTDYVFDGTKSGAYVETDTTNPLSVYGRTKLQGERALTASGAHHFIFRTSWVYGLHGSNFIKTILRLAREREELRIVADQFGAPTGAALIADITAQVLGQYFKARNKEDFPFGVFHLTASGRTTWHGYARYCVETADQLGIKLKTTSEAIHAIPSSAYPLPAQRPVNSCLECGRLAKSFGIDFPDWRSGVEQSIESILSGHLVF
jgi:dTDP-4-dehydrorhamnose reductase